VSAGQGTAVPQISRDLSLLAPLFQKAVEAAIKECNDAGIDAFVYDRPLLVWSIDQKYASTLQVLDTSFDHQDYAVALANGSALREPLNVTMLSIMESDWWKQALFRDLRE